MIPDWRTMPISPAIAMPPMPMGRPKAAKSCSGDIPAVSIPTEPTTGTTRNQMRAEPAAMIAAYFRPMM